MSDERILYARFTAKRGREEEVESLLAALVGLVRAEPGNIRFDAHRATEDRRAFFVYEAYRDAAAFQNHVAADYGVAFNAALSDLIEEDASQLTWLERI